ncbi:acyltransferase [Bradyrhizobium tropiciagri]|uniref:acyltransferase family protein n=1 Tax=Bradyrhizobium tropiciagri TaxID=312253 RepID=UPI001BAA46D4|nr:acyltransferase [Bradyrhizobium tropiciagri]MBR0871303.1 acyltransferase [Bradyrhizobium tropiciagri]
MARSRLGFLDGLRGWGAVSVVVYHAFASGLAPAPGFEQLRYFVLLNGFFAVQVFFLVSGFALSFRYLADGNLAKLAEIAAGRYVRLAIPILAACAVVHVAMLAGWFSGDRLPKFAPFLTFDPTITHLLKFGLFDVFFDYIPAESYIGPLWTMRPELLGSYLLLGSVVAFRPVPFRIVLFCAIAAALFWSATTIGPYLAMFMIGAVLADCFNRGWLDHLPSRLALVLIVFGVCAVALPIDMDKCLIIGAVPFMVGCIAHPTVRSWLESPLSRRLGELSFPLYLIHGPVNNIIGEPLMRSASSLAWKISIDLLIIALAFLAAIAFKPINDRAIRWSHTFALWVLRPFAQRPKAAQPLD